MVEAGEGGLLSIAFPPSFSFSPGDYVYAYYSGAATGPGNTLALTVARFPLLDGMETTRADEDAEETIYVIEKVPTNHNGGTIAFRGSQLYLALGDGGGGGDPEDNAQDDASAFGKVLRFDTVAGAPWTPEVWAKGLRNPYRWSFDRQTGDLYIGDVGQSAWEEIDVQGAAATPGANFGWDVHEGDACFDPTPSAGELPCDDPSFTFPVYQYAHVPGGSCAEGARGSVTGGYVYRGSALPEIQGHYFFADFCTDEIWSLQWDGGTGTLGPVQSRGAELSPAEGALESIVSFGEDANGELYLVNMFAGEVFRIPEATAAPAGLAVGAALSLLGTRRRRDRAGARAVSSDDAGATPPGS